MTSWQFVSILITISLFAFLWVDKKLIDLDNKRLIKLAKWSGKYSKSAREFLMASEEFPESVLDGLNFWNAATADKSMPFAFVAAFQMRRQKLINGETVRSITINEEERNFFAKRPDLQKKYLDVIINALMTISYSHWFWGPVLKISITEFLAENQDRKIETISREIQNKISKKHPPRISFPILAAP